MAYFVHNKYDAASVAALAAIDQSANTVIDYYGEYETYKNLDTSAGFGILYDSLSYITRGTVLYDGQSDKDDSHFNFGSSIVIKSIQIGRATATSSGVTVNIPTAIDPTKSIVLIDSNTAYNAALSSLSAGTMKVTAATSTLFSYQIIEFM